MRKVQGVLVLLFTALLAAPGWAEAAPEDASSAAAKPDPQANQKPVSIAGLLGNGFEDGYNIGLGVRGGYTLPNHAYVGGTLLYHLGTTKEAPGFKTTVNVILIGAEGGYSISAGPVIVRPYGGIGMAVVRVNTTSTFPGVPEGSDSQNKLFVAPGAVVLYPIGSAFVGGDARFTIISDNNAFGLFLTGGTTF